MTMRQLRNRSKDRLVKVERYTHGAWSEIDGLDAKEGDVVSITWPSGEMVEINGKTELVVSMSGLYWDPVDLKAYLHVRPIKGEMV